MPSTSPISDAREGLPRAPRLPDISPANRQACRTAKHRRSPAAAALPATTSMRARPDASTGRHEAVRDGHWHARIRTQGDPATPPCHLSRRRRRRPPQHAGWPAQNDDGRLAVGSNGTAHRAQHARAEPRAPTRAKEHETRALRLVEQDVHGVAGGTPAISNPTPRTAAVDGRSAAGNPMHPADTSAAMAPLRVRSIRPDGSIKRQP